MLRKLIVGSIVPLVFGALAMSAGTASAQEQMKQPEQGQKQLSKKGQEAAVRLHALSQGRAQFATAVAQRATDPQVKKFFQTRAQDYMQADQNLVTFARGYGVDLNSPKMQKEAGKYLGKWQKEREKIMKAEPKKAAKMALDTYTKENKQAIKDLRTLRGQVKEQELSQLINERIAALEQETTRAEALNRQLQQGQQRQPQSQGQQPGQSKGQGQGQEQQPQT